MAEPTRIEQQPRAGRTRRAGLAAVPDRQPGMIAVLCALLSLAAPAAGNAGPAGSRSQSNEAGVPVDAEGLAEGPGSRMEMLYERTIFRVDVLRLSLRFGPSTAAELERLIAGREHGDAIADDVAEAVMDARDVLIRSRFLRDVDFDQYMDGIRESMGHAREAGFLSAAEYVRLAADIEAQYEPIHERGLREDDVIWYRIRGDTFRVVLEAADGTILLDRTTEGSDHVRATLGGYMAPESDFREDLIRSLFDQ